MELALLPGWNKTVTVGMKTTEAKLHCEGLPWVRCLHI